MKKDGTIHDENLLRAMRCNVVCTDVATMPIPLYERMKRHIQETAPLETKPVTGWIK